jgi:hypothetical protein
MVEFPAFFRFRQRKKDRKRKMARYFLQDIPLASFERMMTQVPRPARGGEEPDDGKAKRKPAERRQSRNPIGVWRADSDTGKKNAPQAPAEIRR